MKRALSIAISTALTVGLVWLLFTQISIGEVVTTLGEVPFSLVVLAGVAYVASVVLRALRFRYLLDDSLTVRRFVSIASLHLFFINLLPLRSGELSLLYYLKKENVSLQKTSAVLLVARVYDFCTIILIGLLGALVVGGSQAQALLPLLLVVGLVMVTGIWVLFGKRWQAYSQRMVGYVSAWAQQKLQSVHNELNALNKANQRKTLALFSVLIWVMAILVYVILLASFLPELSQAEKVLGASFNILLNALPIHGLAGFGTAEGVWTLVFLWFSDAQARVIAAGFSFHILKKLYVIIGGAIGWMLYHGRETS